jgi:hypothetical protein
MQLYIHRNGEQFGPYPVELARDYLAAGTLLPGDLAWHEGAVGWVPLNQIAEIATPAPASPAAWIPPRRTNAPESQTTSALVSANGSVSPASVPAAKGEATPARNGAGRVKSTRPSPVNQLSRRQRAIGARNMGVGAFFCVGGIAFTVISYEAAVSGRSGGTYFVTWGAVIFGGIQFIKGAIQFIKG